MTERTLDPEKLDVEIAYDDGTTRRLEASEYTLDPAELPGGVNGEYLVNITSEQGGKTWKAAVSVQLDTPKMLKDYTAAELQVIADDLAANERESEYWAEFNLYLQEDQKWYFTLTDGTRMEFRIVGINHDDRSWAQEDKGDVEKAGLTMQAVGLLPKTYQMNESNTNHGGWRDSALRANMNETSGEINGLFDDLLPYVATVDKLSKNRDDGTATNIALKNISATATSDKLWIMSYSEIVETCPSSWDGLEGEGTQYEYWDGKVTNNYSGNDCLIKYRLGDTSAYTWWERSIQPNFAGGFVLVNNCGDPSITLVASDPNGVCPCFCFGTSYEEPPEYWIDVPADNAEAKKLGVASTTLKPADIVAAANDIATNKDKSAYYPMYHSFMENDVFMKVNWGDGQTYNVRIVGFNHDDITGGVGKAGITWQFVDLLNDTYAMNDTDTNNGGWRDSALRANMNSGTIWSQVPKTLAQDILAVDKYTKNRDDGTTTNDDLKNIAATATSDKLWVMSYPEIVETCVSWANGLEGEGSQYDYWNGKVTKNSSDNDCLKKYLAKPQPSTAQPTSAKSWWERSVSPSYATHFLGVTNNGYPNINYHASDTTGVCPCFSMGEPDPEYWIEREDGSIMKPAQINAAAKSIADEGTASPYYAEFKNFMDNGGDWDTAANAPGATFGQALEEGFGLMHIKWGDGREYTARIVGINHDDKSDGTGKAGLTWQFTGLLYNGARYNPTGSNNGGWRDSELRFRMNPAELATNRRSWRTPKLIMAFGTPCPRRCRIRSLL